MATAKKKPSEKPLPPAKAAARHVQRLTPSSLAYYLGRAVDAAVKAAYPGVQKRRQMRKEFQRGRAGFTRYLRDQEAGR